jgi:hypothetical protein
MGPAAGQDQEKEKATAGNEFHGGLLRWGLKANSNMRLRHDAHYEAVAGQIAMQ